MAMPRPPVVLLIAVLVLSVSAGAVPAPELRVDPARVTDLTFAEPTPVRRLYDAIARAFDLEIAFDREVEDVPVALERSRVDAREALDAVSQVAGLAWFPTGERSVIVAPETPSKRREHAPMVMATWQLQHAEVRDVMTLARSLLGVKNVGADAARGVIAATDASETIAAFDELVRRVDRPTDEVSFDVALVRIDRRALAELGADPATPEAWSRFAAAGRVHRHAATSVGVVGARQGRLQLRARLGAERVVDLGLTVEAHVVRESRDVLAAFDLEVSTVPGLVPAEGVSAVVQKVRSSRVLADGATLLVELPGLATLDEGAKGASVETSWVATLTPRVVRVGTSSAEEPLWIGTEGRRVVPAGPPAPDAGSG